MAGSLSLTELAAMRAEAALYLPDLCTINRDIVTRDEYGGENREEVVVATNVPCHVNPPSDAELEAAGKIIDRSAFIFTTAYSAPEVELGDRIQLTSLEREGRVISVRTDSSYEIENNYLCEDVD